MLGVDSTRNASRRQGGLCTHWGVSWVLGSMADFLWESYLFTGLENGWKISLQLGTSNNVWIK